MTAPVVAGRTLGLNALLVLVAIILFLLGTFGVQRASSSRGPVAPVTTAR